MAWDVPKDPSLVPDYVPQKAYTKSTVHSLQNVDPYNFSGGRNREIRDAAEGARGNLLTRLLGGFFNIGQVLDNIATAFFGGGPFDPTSALGRISDKSMADKAAIIDMQNRQQILEGIIGYGSWVASQNLFITFDQNNPGMRTMSFDHQVGPSVGVGLVTDSSQANKKVQRLNSKGLWQVIAQTRARNTAFSGDHKVYLDIVVKRPNGAEYYRKSMDAVAVAPPTVGLGGDGQVTLQLNVMFTVPDPYYTVHVELFTGKWRWFYGGSQWSGLTILKHSSEVENEGTVDPGTPPVAG